MNKIRVAALQYYIRPVKSFTEFEDQVSSLVETAEDYKVKLLVFPEYFTTQLLTLGDTKEPISEQIRRLADQEERVKNLLLELSHKYKIHIVGGTIPSFSENGEKIYNRSYVTGPNSNNAESQVKLHMTRFESEDWLVSAGERLRIFDTEFGKMAITICYDVEFPEIARVAAREGVRILVVPSCTDDRQGFLRVRYCAQARAIENQLFVIHSGTVGSLPMVPAVSMNYGQASILTPSDFPFSRDGILAEGQANLENMVIGELNLDLIDSSRASGTVLPLRDSHTTAELLKVVDHVKIS
ncbi:MAG TPA: acyltransferase [Bdellovibrionales bacterium]|nr:acyltransferase [Pseudobdellovibrionaceae bacterium]HAG91990.1 acyltransferase [Bdellovibrionales bacterium]|tara:strand:+ start:440 stop:1333 length:894 start_codon:yes stop_codon:yes gene_type:complete